MNTPLIEGDRFVIVIDDNLTEYKRKTLTYLYMPILGAKATNLYTTFFSLVPFGQTESEPRPHGELFNLLQVKKPSDFLKKRESLEALGLLDTYFYQKKEDLPGLYVYVVKDVLTPYRFLNNSVLSTLLKDKIGKHSFDKVVLEFLVHRFDIKNFEKVTKSFDQVFEIASDNKKMDYQTWWVDSKNTGIKVANHPFDYEYLVILLSALDILDMKEIRSVKLYEAVKHYGFFFSLTPEEMKNAISNATTKERKVDYQELAKHVKILYDKKNRKLDVKPVASKKSMSSNEMVKQLETLSPADIVANITNTQLLGSEIQLFSDLMASTGISLGVLNVLIIYVLKEKNGEIPAYNYFLRIANSWIRAGIKTTEDALEHINKDKTYVPKGNKKVRPVADWFEDYLKDVNDKMKPKQTQTEVNLEELEQIFNPQEKKQKVK